MQSANWDKPIMPLLLEHVRINDQSNLSPKPTAAYIERVRVSHENANVPPFSTFEAGRKLYMGDRYQEVPETWEDRLMDLPTDDTLSTLASTQVREDTSEIAVVLINPALPVIVTTDRPPSKRTKSSTALLNQSVLDSFLIVVHTLSPTKKSHPPPDIPPPNTQIEKAP